MFKVRLQQLKAIERSQKEAFEEELFRHVCVFWPEEIRGAGSAAIRQLISSLVDVAFEHGIETEYGVCRLVEFAMRSTKPRTVLSHAEIGTILRDQRLSESGKIRQLSILLCNDNENAGE